MFKAELPAVLRAVRAWLSARALKGVEAAGGAGGLRQEAACSCCLRLLERRTLCCGARRRAPAAPTSSAPGSRAANSSALAGRLAGSKIRPSAGGEGIRRSFRRAGETAG